MTYCYQSLTNGIRMAGLHSISGKWRVEDGNKAYFMINLFFSSYLPKQLLANAQVYAKPVENPSVSMDERFLTFINQIMKVHQEK